MWRRVRFPRLLVSLADCVYLFVILFLLHTPDFRTHFVIYRLLILNILLCGKRKLIFKTSKLKKIVPWVSSHTTFFIGQKHESVRPALGLRHRLDLRRAVRTARRVQTFAAGRVADAQRDGGAAAGGRRARRPRPGHVGPRILRAAALVAGPHDAQTVRLAGRRGADERRRVVRSGRAVQEQRHHAVLPFHTAGRPPPRPAPWPVRFRGAGGRPAGRRLRCRVRGHGARAGRAAGWPTVRDHDFEMGKFVCY